MIKLPERLIMITEIIIYEFDNVPIDIGEMCKGYTPREGYRPSIYPLYAVANATKSKNVNEWIRHLRELGVGHISSCGFTSGYLFIAVWNTGFGNYRLVGS